MQISRRQMLAAGSAAAAVTALSACAAPTTAASPGRATSASVPTRRAQSPGYYRVPLGSFTVTAISDGTFDLDASGLLLGISRSDLSGDLATSFLTSPVRTSVNAYVVDTGRGLVLIDTGCGSLLTPTTGQFVANLRAAGYEPSQIDTVVFTHLHSDHIGGLLEGGALTFPDARTRILLQAEESGYWLDASHRAAAPSGQQEFFDSAMKVFEPYRQQNRLQTIAANAEIVPGVRAVSFPGHTPGHSGYLVDNGSARMLLWGDIVHVAEIQFARPDVSIEFDTTPAEAEARRRQVFQDAAAGRYLIAGAHLPFPGIGHVAAADRAFRYVPVNYSTY